jgi:high-affinity nickel-transport protein
MKPIRKLYYNITITLVSAVVAVIVGGIEALGLVASKLSLQGGLWDYVTELNDNFGVLGYVIIGIFAASWLASIAIYRLKRYDEIEVRVG